MTARATCHHCGNPFQDTSRAQRKRFCSDRCRLAAYRAQPVEAQSVSEIGQKTAQWCTPPEADFSENRVVIKQQLTPPKTHKIAFTGDLSLLQFETAIKLTDGTLSRTEKSDFLGAGLSSPRALAWVSRDPMVEGWYAYAGDCRYGPTTIAQAKKAAMCFVTGQPMGRLPKMPPPEPEPPHSPKVYRFDVTSTLSGWTGHYAGEEAFRKVWDMAKSAIRYLEAKHPVYSDDVILLYQTRNGRTSLLSRSSVSEAIA